MPSSTSSRKKALKGSVQVKSSHSRLQLVFSYGGKRHYISTGLADSVTNRKLAELKAKEIEKDIFFERFDHTLTRYKSPNSSALSTVTPNTTPIAKNQPTLDQLWEQYVDFKRPQVSQNTLTRDYARYRSHITKLPTKSLVDAVKIRDFLLANLTANAAKRTLTNISACCDWAMKSQIVEANPFDGMSAEIKLPKSNTDEMDIEPFTREERERIISTFSTDQYYSGYTQLIKFLFFTGCRPSEAIALQWKHIDDYVHFEQAVAHSENGLVLKMGLKTQERRRFRINRQLRDILSAIEPEESYTSEDYLFPSPEGKFIDVNNFRNRAWKSVLGKCGIPYRKLYQTRHTFVTLCLEAGIDAKDVARLVGNSPEVIYRHYAGNKRDLQVPEL
ncbi:MAG: tyrosine-type recombinase/integrase [Cyanobacteria bacterium P01_A01_bin.17]